ncbi:hypothetical protein Tco_0659031 [Tanacetum coccineum]
MSLFRSPNRVKTFLSLGPSLVNTVALAGLLWRVGLSLSCLSLENTLAVREGRVPLDAVTELSLLSLGLFSLSQDLDYENCVREFRCELSPLSAGRHPELPSGVCLLPLPAVFRTAELAERYVLRKGTQSGGACGGLYVPHLFGGAREAGGVYTLSRILSGFGLGTGHLLLVWHYNDAELLYDFTIGIGMKFAMV